MRPRKQDCCGHFPGPKKRRPKPGKRAGRAKRNVGPRSASRRQRSLPRRTQLPGSAEGADDADTSSAFVARSFQWQRRSKQHSYPGTEPMGGRGEPTIGSIPASKTALGKRFRHRNLGLRTAHLSRVAQRISVQSDISVVVQFAKWLTTKATKVHEGNIRDRRP